MAAKKPAASSEPATSTEVPPVDATPPQVVDKTAPQVVDKTAPPVVDKTAPQVVYVTAPQPPRRRGNRLLGSLLSLVAALVYGLLLAGILAVSAQILIRPGVTVNIFGSPSFYFPVVLFFIGMVLVVLVVNRAGWWSHLIGSIVVALIVYFGTIGLILLMAGVIAKTPAEAAIDFQSGLVNPLVIIAALLAREVAIWGGAVISWRGKKVKARNVAEKDNFDREQAELVAT